MNTQASIEILNRLLVLHNRSLAAYLQHAMVWWQQRDRQAAATLAQLVADQQRIVQRLGALMVERNGDVDVGEFPLEYSALNDLSGEFLLPRLLASQRELVATVEQCLPQLSQDPVAEALAQEALGSAKAHWDMLQENARDLTGARI